MGINDQSHSLTCLINTSFKKMFYDYSYTCVLNQCYTCGYLLLILVLLLTVMFAFFFFFSLQKNKLFVVTRDICPSGRPSVEIIFERGSNKSG